MGGRTVTASLALRETLAALEGLKNTAWLRARLGNLSLASVADGPAADLRGLTSAGALFIAWTTEPYTCRGQRRLAACPSPPLHAGLPENCVRGSTDTLEMKIGTVYTEACSIPGNPISQAVAVDAGLTPPSHIFLS